MSKYTISLPLRYRVDVTFVKRRSGVSVDESIIPTLTKIRSWRSGNKISRLARHVFEHKKINKILGTQLAVLTIAGTSLPHITQNYDYQANTPEVIRVNEAITSTKRGLQLPLNSIKVNQGFFSYHPAVDFGGKKGDPVHPIMTGRVQMVQFSRFAYGNAIILDHGGGITSLYAHLSKVNVKEGQNVVLEDTIGEVGSTGRSTGNHLHLEVRDSGKAINPFAVLPIKEAAVKTTLSQL